MKPKFSVLLNIVCGDRKMQLDVPTKQSLGEYAKKSYWMLQGCYVNNTK